MSEDRN